MAARRIDVPYRSYDQLRRVAEDFLAKYHPPGAIPVPIEEIIEFEFGMDIIPIFGLHKSFDIDAFVSRDLTAISVDRHFQENQPGRYRFSLAHELAHVLIHGDIIGQLGYSSIKEWKAIVASIVV